MAGLDLDWWCLVCLDLVMLRCVLVDKTVLIHKFLCAPIWFLTPRSAHISGGQREREREREKEREKSQLTADTCSMTEHASCSDQFHMQHLVPCSTVALSLPKGERK